MENQLATMDEASSQVVNSIDSVNSQELAMDVDFDNIKAEIVSVSLKSLFSVHRVKSLVC